MTRYATLLWMLGAGMVSAGQPMAPATPASDAPALIRFALAARKDGVDWLHTGMRWLGEREATTRFLGLVGTTRGPGGRGGSWSKPGQTRFTWAWMAERFDSDHDDAVTSSEFAGPPEWFTVLDRDHDGKITAIDLDWNDDAPLAKASAQAKSLFGVVDLDGNGRVTPEEWSAFYKKLNREKEYLAQDDLLSLFVGSDKKSRGNFGKGDAVRWLQIQAFFAGDVGSWREGPGLGERAPDFTLASPDGSRRITLSRSQGKKPVVLVFGSFT